MSCTASTLSLGGAYTIEHAAELQQLLLAQLPEASALCLTGISEIDCAGLQLLLASKRQYPELILCAPSPAVQALFAKLNLSDLLTV